jgi:hypothetical protein
MAEEADQFLRQHYIAELGLRFILPAKQKGRVFTTGLLYPPALVSKLARFATEQIPRQLNRTF